MKKVCAGLLLLTVALIPLELRADPPSVVLSDGGIEFPDGTVQETSATVGPPATLTVNVDCGSGDKINDALMTPAKELTLKITGICNENVAITRDDVRLAGGDPTIDGIHGVVTGAEIEPPVISIQSAVNVWIEDLTIASGPGDGADVRNGRAEFSNCVVDANSGWGVLAAEGSTVEVLEVTFRSNAGGAAGAVHSSRMTIMDSTLTGNGSSQIYSAYARSASSLWIWDSTITGELGVSAGSGALASLIDTPITAAGTALFADFTGAISVFGDDIVVQIAGAIVASRKALLWVSEINQTTTGASTNKALKDSTVTFRGAVIQGLALETFSNGTLEGATAGAVTCASGSDLYCELGTVVTSSTCGLCPVPAP